MAKKSAIAIGSPPSPPSSPASHRARTCASSSTWEADYVPVKTITLQCSNITVRLDEARAPACLTARWRSKIAQPTAIGRRPERRSKRRFRIVLVRFFACRLFSLFFFFCSLSRLSPRLFGLAHRPCSGERSARADGDALSGRRGALAAARSGAAQLIGAPWRVSGVAQSKAIAPKDRLNGATRTQRQRAALARLLHSAFCAYDSKRM